MYFIYCSHKQICRDFLCCETLLMLKRACLLRKICLFLYETRKNVEKLVGNNKAEVVSPGNQVEIGLPGRVEFARKILGF